MKSFGKVLVVGFALCFLAVAPSFAQAALSLGTGHILLPAQGNYAVAGIDAQWQLQAAFEWRTGKHLAFTLAYAQDSLKIERWAQSHNFTFTQAEPLGFDYGLWDVGISIPFDAGKWTISPEAGMSLLHMAGHEMPGYFAGIGLRYSFTAHWFAGLDVKYRYLPSVPTVGVANIGQTSLQFGYKF